MCIRDRFYALLTIDATLLQGILMALFVIPAVMLLREGVVEGAVARDKVVAMLIIFTFNVLFWCFFEQAGSSFNFLAEKIVNRDIGMQGLFQALAGTDDFPVSWFQSVNSVAIIVPVSYTHLGACRACGQSGARLGVAACARCCAVAGF